MSEIVTPINKISAPYGKEMEFFHVVYENGFCILRVRIREGHRFTMLDLDSATALQLGQLMNAWGNANKPG